MNTFIGSGCPHLYHLFQNRANETACDVILSNSMILIVSLGIELYVRMYYNFNPIVWLLVGFSNSQLHLIVSPQAARYCFSCSSTCSCTCSIVLALYSFIICCKAMEDTESIRVLVCQRIEQVENAMKSLQCLRKTLLHKAYEVRARLI